VKEKGVDQREKEQDIEQREKELRSARVYWALSRSRRRPLSG